MADLSQITPWFGYLGSGLIVTVELAALAGVLTICLSTVIAVASISPLRGAAMVTSIYTDLFRSIPLLALLIYIYFGLGPMASRVGVSTFWIAVLGLTLCESAYLAEVYRGGFQAIPSGQWEAASSLGLRWFSAFRLVVAPQAIPAGIPTTVNQIIYIIKDSSLASLIGVGEVTLSASVVVSQTFLPMQVYLVLAIIYLAVIIPLTLLARRLEAVSQVGGLGGGGAEGEPARGVSASAAATFEAAR